jgi:hypothetical protein
LTRQRHQKNGRKLEEKISGEKMSNLFLEFEQSFMTFGNPAKYGKTLPPSPCPATASYSLYWIQETGTNLATRSQTKY